jgi:hypothetical protein
MDHQKFSQIGVMRLKFLEISDDKVRSCKRDCLQPLFDALFVVT